MHSWKETNAVSQDLEIVSGVWVFQGTRVPVASLFENLRSGATIDEYLDWFPGVSRAQLEAILECEAIAASSPEP